MKPREPLRIMFEKLPNYRQRLFIGRDRWLERSTVSLHVADFLEADGEVAKPFGPLRITVKKLPHCRQ